MNIPCGIKREVPLLDCKRLRICIVATVPMPLNVFMMHHIRELSKKYQVTLVANGTENDVRAMLNDNVIFSHIRIERKISLLRDVSALYALWRLFRAERFHCVHSLMPKSGLLAMIAAWFARVPIRIHLFTGQVWATRRGVVRCAMKSLDKVVALCASHLLTDSYSQQQYLVDEGVAARERLTVLCDGSVCGVDMARFMPHARKRHAIRLRYGIPDDAIVALYLGRLTREKGVPELLFAFSLAAERCDKLHLFVVGPDEEGVRISHVDIICRMKDRVHFDNFTQEPESYMAAADFFVMPSHREGFGLTIIEAAACGIPSVGTRIYGLIDAIVDGDTGILVPVGDSMALADAMVHLSECSDHRYALGVKAMRRVENSFQAQRLADSMREYYSKILCESELCSCVKCGG